MSAKLLAEHHLRFLSLKGGCTCSSESTLVKMPHCWESHATAHFNVVYCMVCVSVWEVDQQASMSKLKDIEIHKTIR